MHLVNTRRQPIRPTGIQSGTPRILFVTVRTSVCEQDRASRWLDASQVVALNLITKSLFKACSSMFAVVITQLAYRLFNYATFPAQFKTAQITLPLNKYGLDKNNLVNYRPISNVSTVSKILERPPLVRIAPHVTASLCFNPKQSAYLRLLKITNDIYDGFDNQQSSVLSNSQPRLIASMIEWRQHMFGVTGHAVDWLKSRLPCIL